MLHHQQLDQGLNVQYLSQVFELLEVSGDNSFRIDASVSPFVFAKAVESINPSLFDQRNYEVILRLASIKPSSAQKKAVCHGMAMHLALSESLKSLLSAVVRESRSHVDLISGFIVVAQYTFTSYVEFANVNKTLALEQFRSGFSAAGIFRPLFPYGQ